MKKILLLIAVTFASAAIAAAQPFLRLPSIIGDHMVLRENSDVTIYGWADPGATVTVEASWGETAKSKSGYDTRWSVTLHTPQASDKPVSITLTSNKKVTRTVEDILIGQVWLCSGQSNMNWSVASGIYDMKEELTDNMPQQIRLFTVPKCAYPQRQMDVEGKWVVCNKDDAYWFSSVGYYFGKYLHEGLGQPVGLINSSWGGTPVEVWTPKEAMGKRPDMVASWKAHKLSQRAGWNIGTVYNAMIWPIRDMNLSGVIWYQGESNKSNADMYAEEFTMMIEQWRKAFRNETLPFYYVQIAPHSRTGVGIDNAYVREAQEQVWKNVSNVGMVCISDQVDDVTDIHPRRKSEVGRRLALMALGQTYGKTGFKYNCPTFKSVEYKKGKAVVSFNDAEDGLVCKGEKVVGLEIAGEDMKFYPGSGMVDGKSNTLVIWSKDVRTPAAVRYCFSDGAIGNLFDTAGLPVAPFRTDAKKFDSTAALTAPATPALKPSNLKGGAVIAKADGMEVRPLAVGTVYFMNRKYKVIEMSDNLKGWQMLSQTASNESPRSCKVTAEKDGKIYVLARYNKKNDQYMKDWTIDKSTVVKYATNDPAKPGVVYLYTKDVKAGQTVALPQTIDFAGATLISEKISY